MLSMVSSLLPSALSEKFEKLDMRPDTQRTNSQPKNTNDEEDDDGVKRKDMLDDSNNKKEKKKKLSHEASCLLLSSSLISDVSRFMTFIMVRPPPNLSNHPLNLQIQLVPAITARERSSVSTTASTPTSSRIAADDIPPPQSPSSPASDSDNGRLSRTMSIRSNRSDTSTFYSSSNTSSVTSFSSGTSTGSGRRMIIPLYNLHAHNVMTNTIFDAGTDARVAKFHKRGLEILGLGILEPTEVWQSKDFGQGGTSIIRTQSGNSLVPPTPAVDSNRAITPEFPHSPGSSRLSLGSDTSSQPHPAFLHQQQQILRADTGIAPPTPVNGAKKLFGKIFRRKEPSVDNNSKFEEGEVISIPVPSPRSPLSPSTPLPTDVQVRPSTAVAKQNVYDVFLPAVLGLTPMLSSPVNQPIGRCFKHVWVLRRWLKTDNDNGLTGIIRKVGREASMYGVGRVGEQGADWIIRFEWSRSKSKQEKAASRSAKRESMDASLSRRRSQTHSRRSSALVNPEEAAAASSSNSSPKNKLDSLRMSRPEENTDGLDVQPSKRSASHSRPTTPSANHSEEDSPGDHDKDYESDPEDSETPWVCYLVITPASSEDTTTPLKKGLGHTRSRSQDVSSIGRSDTRPIGFPQTSVPPTPLKIKVATLSPAPHHPKVVCQLRVTFPLPDVEVERGAMKKRVLLPDGSTRSTLSPDRINSPQALTLSAEEIKDVICCTAFWVVVREAIGGVGKVNRKGDGFRLRK
ncbi:hypothetical protein Clacol_008286 [Clathrus columnatus]|uniref:Uncharacterized protein n=1 Tax=Clathrus columnatus TaxID=1419009 RepID=A0AAV5ALM1_9AGAM|nr:hypothetical protein Clacol_008286 [Clathrus columnatus]